ncbi:MAG: hypothetical protein E4H08_10350 [Candidatus Atribacteria bacterium]|nr:MAG: hypothetical protein E4H08_10350 [Candidatus Atribacteria bacterium]
MGERACLVKFGNSDHIERMRCEGLLHMNPVLFFWGIEDDELRGDQNDCVDRIARGTEGSLRLPDVGDAAIEITNWILRFPPTDAKGINLFCMYALRPSFGTFPVDERNLRFGSSALVIYDPSTFISRVSDYLKHERIGGEADLVEYVDQEYEGTVGPLRKLVAFAYQSEWRLVCYGGDGGPRQLSLGSLEDISVIVPSDQINVQIEMCS